MVKQDLPFVNTPSSPELHQCLEVTAAVPVRGWEALPGCEMTGIVSILKLPLKANKYAFIYLQIYFFYCGKYIFHGRMKLNKPKMTVDNGRAVTALGHSPPPGTHYLKQNWKWSFSFYGGLFPLQGEVRTGQLSTHQLESKTHPEPPHVHHLC